MKTIEIPRNNWPDFADSFSKSHDGWMVNVEILDPRAQAPRQLTNRPFRGLTFDQKTSFQVLTGDRKGDHLCHPVRNAERVWLDQTDEGLDQALAIESAEHWVTLVQFCHPFRTYMLDPAVE